MAWVNLDDVYVNKSGDSIAGNLSVGGALTINDAKGTGGMYNVANEITTLRDSVSRVDVLVKNVAFKRNPNGNFEIWFNGDDFSVCINFSEKHVGVYNGKTNRGKSVKLW